MAAPQNEILSPRPIAVSADRTDPFLWSSQPLDAGRVRLYAIGLPYSLLDGSPVDDLELPHEHDDQQLAENRKSFSAWWSIESAADARRTLGNLSDPGMINAYSLVTPFVEKALEYAPGSEIERAHHDFLSDLELANGMTPEFLTKSYREWLAALRDPAVRSVLPRRLPAFDTAWDLARVVLVSRSTLCSEYLTPAEVGGYIATASATARHTFRSWRDFGTSYLVGRLFWAKDESPSDIQDKATETSNLIRRCLADPDSPWNLVSIGD